MRVNEEVCKIAPALDSGLWSRTIAESLRQDQAEELTGHGRWWLEPDSCQVALSLTAARFLGVAPGLHMHAASCCAHVVAEDLAVLNGALERAGTGGAPIDCDFRLIDPLEGVRWFRMRSMATAPASIMSGVLIDITSVKHAAMREEFNFALTQYLIGTDTLGEAVTKIIQLVCEDLGWEWGAYWALDFDEAGANVLQCKHSWHGTDSRLAQFQQVSESLNFAPGQGVVGRVWRTGEAEWVKTSTGDPDFLRGEQATNDGLRSGYMFPVTYVTPDGVLHRPGVLEFFSHLPRQREAQLPNMSASIGALVALTAQRMVQQAHIRRLALTDEMTGLANRIHFHAMLDAACRNGDHLTFGVLYIDLDQFKPINDAFGHQAGNVVLSEFARRLQGVVPPGCEIGRLGGDEFAILAPPNIAAREVEAIAEAVLQAARTSFMYEGNELSVSASIGISLFPAHGTSTTELLHAADAAMYLSKRNGRNLFSHFIAEGKYQQGQLAEQLTLLSELQHAYMRKEFFLEYQPIFDSFDHRVVAVEALIRWRKPNGEIVPPDKFIPIAEQGRLIVHIGRWVAEQACRDLPLMHAAGMGDVQVHINMAAPEFVDSELPGELMAILAQAGVAPRHFCLELTEGVVMSRPEKTIPVMCELKRLGFEISLDDFGMGYSSLSRLKRLPISSFKIDRLFVGGVPQDRDDCAIVRAILELGRNMKLRVIAEGVETDAQLSFLSQFGCLIQGYLLGRPMPVDRLIALHGNEAKGPAAADLTHASRKARLA
jgi:diguanylate cyclase (GGDEF)-like protein